MKRLMFIAFVIILVIPVLLNYLLQCPSPLCNIIGEKEAPNVWLNFWANYSGAVISALVSFFILSKTLDQNHKENEMNRNSDNKKFTYEQQKNDLNLLIKNLIKYLDCFNQNRLVRIYNQWRKTNDNEKCRIKIKKIFDEAFIAMEECSMLFNKDEINNSEILLKIFNKNYKTLLCLLIDFQGLISCNSSHWNDSFAIKKEIKEIYPYNISEPFENILSCPNVDIFYELLKSYENISQRNVEAEIRHLIEEKRIKMESIIK